MFYKNLVVLLIFCSSLFSNTLEIHVEKLLRMNPLIQEKCKLIKTQEKKEKITEHDYYKPSVNFKQKSEYIKYKQILHLAQSKNKESVAIYNYLLTVNTLSFEMANVYIDLLECYEFIKNEKKNIKTYESVYEKVKENLSLHKIKRSELNRVGVKLSLARSKLQVQENKLRSLEYRYKNIVGVFPSKSTMVFPSLKMESTTKSLRSMHPSFLQKEATKEYKDTLYIDLLAHKYVQKKTKKELEEILNSSWKMHGGLKTHYKTLDEFYTYAQLQEKTQKEKTTLLDFFLNFNETSNLQAQLIQTKYQKIRVKYRILDSLGLLVLALYDGDLSKYYKYEKEKMEYIFLTNFKNDKSILEKDLIEKIRNLSELLKKRTDLKARIVGHTSRTKVSNAHYNVKLSLERANRIKKELVSYGIDTKRLKVSGEGFTQPRVSNRTKDGRIQNRRVEITLIK